MNAREMIEREFRAVGVETTEAWCAAAERVIERLLNDCERYRSTIDHLADWQKLEDENEDLLALLRDIEDQYGYLMTRDDGKRLPIGERIDAALGEEER